MWYAFCQARRHDYFKIALRLIQTKVSACLWNLWGKDVLIMFVAARRQAGKFLGGAAGVFDIIIALFTFYMKEDTCSVELLICQHQTDDPASGAIPSAVASPPSPSCCGTSLMTASPLSSCTISYLPR